MLKTAQNCPQAGERAVWAIERVFATLNKERYLYLLF
jgi:hypothetical protein